MATQKPKSVAEIVKDAESFDHKTQYPLRIALRTAQNILNQAANCLRTGNTQDAYLFLYRHAEFCMSQIASHPDRKLPEFKAQVSKATKDVRADLEKLEELKVEVTRKYERWQESVKRIEIARQTEREQRRITGKDGARRGPDEVEEVDAQFDGASLGTSKILRPGEHSDLALKLAHRELRRRGVKRSPEDVNREQREFNELAQNIKDLGRRIDGRDGLLGDRSGDHGTDFAYPGVPTHHKETSSAEAAREAQVPPLPPQKSPLQTDHGPMLPPKSNSQPSQAAEALESSQYTFKSTAKTEAGVLLRPLFIPSELRSRFLSLAASNTRNNLETCGILCGSLISNALFISHLVIPEQISTSDTCDTTEEGDNALFDYVDGQELMVCGWIHTHPTQTCFLSSRDLHTSVGYQVMLPESVAIVCAPSRDPAFGIFRLTDPPGKQAILNCNKTGLFHPHEQSHLYTDAQTPGHVSELKGLQFQVVDLRKG